MDEARLALLQQVILFEGFTQPELARLLPYLKPAEHRYKKGEALLLAGYESNAIGVVLSGRIQAVKTTPGGAQFMVSQMGPGGTFGDVLSGGSAKSPVSVLAAEDCTVLLFSAQRLFAVPAAAAPLHLRLLANLVRVMSHKYFALNARLDLLLAGSLRKRLAAYLLAAEGDGAGRPFTIPFSRAALADYLGCERSALSREVSALAKQGIIETSRCRFRILNHDALKNIF